MGVLCTIGKHVLLPIFVGACSVVILASPGLIFFLIVKYTAVMLPVVGVWILWCMGSAALN